MYKPVQIAAIRHKRCTIIQITEKKNAGQLNPDLDGLQPLSGVFVYVEQLFITSSHNSSSG